MSVKVYIPMPLRELVDGTDAVRVDQASTVGAVLDDLIDRRPVLRRHLYAETGAVRTHVNIFLNDEDIRRLRGLDTAVAQGDTLSIVPSIAGG